MHAIGNALKLGLGVAVSTGALVAASQLSATGHAEAAEGAKIVAIVVAGSLMHIPAAFLMAALHMAADGMEGRLSAIVHADRPVANEDVWRAGRRAAVRGVKVSVNRYIKSAKADLMDHDLVQAKLFRRAAHKWVAEEIRATRRKDRPSKGGWIQTGLGFEGVVRCDGLPGRSRKIEDDAWAEFAVAVAQRGAKAPDGFRCYFSGAANCGLGWRRAGHLMFMRELKDNHDAFVGFIVDGLLRWQDAMTNWSPENDMPRSHADGGVQRGRASGKARPPLKLKRPTRSTPKPADGSAGAEPRV